MLSKFNFTFYTDSGHGWLEVPKALAKALDVRISPFSYEDDEYYYLEEDLDAGVFTKAAKEAGLKFEVFSEHFDGQHPLKKNKRVNDPLYVSPFSG